MAARVKHAAIVNLCTCAGYVLGVGNLPLLAIVTTACAKRTGAAASVERRRRAVSRQGDLAGVTRARQRQCLSAFARKRFCINYLNAGGVQVLLWHFESGAHDAMGRSALQYSNAIARLAPV